MYVPRPSFSVLPSIQSEIERPLSLEEKVTKDTKLLHWIMHEKSAKLRALAVTEQAGVSVGGGG